MSDLALTLDDTDFATLVERVRAQIPPIAPTWTDFNVHDPGITLLELMAFIADSQIYSLGRLRRDERRSYAVMMGVGQHGPRPARGLLWPKSDLPVGAKGVWLPATTLATAPGDAPACTLDAGIWITPARLVRLATRAPGGSEQDLTAANGRPTASFAPFGTAPAPGAELRLRFQGALVRDVAAASGEAPVIALGVAVEPFGQPDDASVGTRPGAVLTAGIVGRFGFDQPVTIVADGTVAFARSGALLLQMPDTLIGQGAPDIVEIVIRLASGAFSLPPRVVRISANALPIRQINAASFEQRATGLPDQIVTLTGDAPADGEPLQVRLLAPQGPQDWMPTPDLLSAGPNDRVFATDPGNLIFRFGNGVNGAIPPYGPPPHDVTIQVNYAACAGKGGNLPAQGGWVVGSAPIRFRNQDPLIGGQDADTLDTLRHTARLDLASARPLVTDADLEAAALAAPLLHVGRADVIDGYDPVTPCLAGALGTRTLVALRQRRRSEATQPPVAEDPGWLAALQRHLRPHLPLGERLRVTGPGYVPLTIKASLTVRRGVDGNAIVASAMQLLQGRLSLLPTADFPPWPLGRSVAVPTIAGWLRRLDGVIAVQSLTLNGQASGSIRLRPHELPVLTLAPSDITAAPLGTGT